MNLLSDPAPSPAAIVAFSVLVFAVTSTAVAGVSAAARAGGDDDAAVAVKRRKAARILLAWLAFTGVLAGSGAISRFDTMPPPVMPLIGLSVVASTWLAMSKLGGSLARSLPVAALVGFQAFRFPLELVLHQLGLDGVLPVQMTFDGMNYDIVTGITAVFVALWAAFGTLPRIVLWMWNILGLVLLLVIVTIAILSTPVPFRVFMNDPANTIITTLPFVWLPTVLVQAAWIGHLLVFRRLRMDRRGA